MRSESRTIPMNSRVVEGPCVLWGAVGIPRFLKVSKGEKLIIVEFPFPLHAKELIVTWP